jgi:hypothetical protein
MKKMASTISNQLQMSQKEGEKGYDEKMAY